MGKALRINSAKRETFLDKVRQELPKGGNLNLCLTCVGCRLLLAQGVSGYHKIN
jgi:hypothetical protein